MVILIEKNFTYNGACIDIVRTGHICSVIEDHTGMVIWKVRKIALFKS